MQWADGTAHWNLTLGYWYFIGIINPEEKTPWILCSG